MLNNKQVNKTMEKETKEVWHLIDITNEDGEVVYNCLMSESDPWFSETISKYPKSKIITDDERRSLLEESDFNIEDSTESYNNN